MQWFNADKEGLRQVNERLVERRGFGMIGGELYQNVMDTDATECVFIIERVPHKPRIILTVEDNGPGFSNLTDAWTLFAPSEKKGDPTKAGRFNLGEKMVLSFAYQAAIRTTSGTVEFDDTGRHHYPRRKRNHGTAFTAELACTAERYDQLIEYLHKILVRPGLVLTVNGDRVESRVPIQQWQETMPTEIGDDLRKTKRQTAIQIFEPADGEAAMLYELGIPVVETDDKWHVNVMQKVPLNVDRDNVTPAYLRDVRVTVLNNMHDKITEDDTTEAWVNEATSDDKCSDEAAETFRVKKYGDKSLASNPLNPEADGVAMSHGYTIIPSRGLSRGQRANLKRAGTLLSSSEKYPTAGKGAYSDDPNAPPVEIVAEDKLTDGHRRIREYTRGLAERLMGVTIAVRFVKCQRGPSGTWHAAYGGRRIDFNLRYLNREWFAHGATPEVDRLIIHEFGHEYAENHLSKEYHAALCRLGAKLKSEALKDVRWFRRFID